MLLFSPTTEEGGEPLPFGAKKQKSLTKRGLTQVPNYGSLQIFPFNLSPRVRRDQIQRDIVDITFVFSHFYSDSDSNTDSSATSNRIRIDIDIINM